MLNTTEWKFKNDDELMREYARKALWSVIYHEDELNLSHKKVATVHALIERLGIPVDRQVALETYENNDEEEPVGNAIVLAQWLFGQQIWYVAYHEKELSNAHHVLGLVKAMIQRGKYEVQLDEIETDERRKKAEREETL